MKLILLLIFLSPFPSFFVLGQDKTFSQGGQCSGSSTYKAGKYYSTLSGRPAQFAENA